MRGPDTTLGGGGRAFPETIWSRILSAKDSDSPGYRKNLDYLISLYWKPVYIFIRLKWGKTNDESKDLTQEFFTSFLERDFLRNVSPEKGRFRTFVQFTLQRFLSNVERGRKTIKRGGGAVRIDFEELEEQFADQYKDADPVKVFDQEWADVVISRAVELMKEQLMKEGKDLHFAAFTAFNRQGTTEPITYVEVAKEVGIKESDVRNYLFYTRKLLRQIVREEVLKSINNPNEVDEELHYLLSITMRGQRC